MKNGGITRVLLVGVVIFIMLSSTGNIALKSMAIGDIGYVSLFDGPKPEFAGIDWNGQHWTTSSPGGASLHNLQGTTLGFDPDATGSGYPSLMGEMTTMYIDQDTLKGSIPSWIPSGWIGLNVHQQDPNLGVVGPSGSNPPYYWNMTDGNVFVMQEWNMKWYMSFSCEWHGNENDQTMPWDPGWWTGDYRNAFSNLDIWIKIGTTPNWYIDGQRGTAHFALAEIRLDSAVALQGWDGSTKDLFGNPVLQPKNDLVSVSPEGQNNPLYIYDNLWGGQEVSNPDPQTYEGHNLNPAMFRNATYAKISLNNFGLTSWANFGSISTRGDVATFVFTVKVFVIGEWAVKDIQQNPSDYGRFVPYTNPTSILDWLFSPTTMAWMIPAGIFLIILIFFPWLLVGLLALIGVGGRRR